MPWSGTSDALPGHIQLLEHHFSTRFPYTCGEQKFFSTNQMNTRGRHNTSPSLTEDQRSRTTPNSRSRSYDLIPCNKLSRPTTQTGAKVSMAWYTINALTYEQSKSVFRKPQKERNVFQARKRSAYLAGRRNVLPSTRNSNWKQPTREI